MTQTEFLNQFKGPRVARSQCELSACPRRLLLFSFGTDVRRRFTRSSGARRRRGSGASRGRGGRRPFAAFGDGFSGDRLHPSPRSAAGQTAKSEWRAGRASHPARPCTTRQLARPVSRRPAPPRPAHYSLIAPPTTPSLPNRRRRGYDRGRRRSCWGGRTLNGRSRRRGDVTRRRTCRALRIPAAFLPLPWVGDCLVRNLQLLFRSQHSCGAACGGRRVWWIESHSTSCPS